MASPSRIVLVGGGHAHAQVIKAFTKVAMPDFSVTLIDPDSAPSYSGMVPGCVSTLYTQEQTKIQLAPLARWAGITHIQAAVVDIDFDTSIMTLSDDSKVHFDVASLDIGSRTRGVHNDGPGPVPGVEEYTIPTRPISHLVQRIANAEKALLAAPGGHHSASINVVIVGGGAAGIELAFAMRARWAKHFGSDFTVTLLDAGSALLPHESSACQKVTNDALASRNISVIHKCHVAEITASHVVLVEDLPPVKYSHVIWATGAQSHPLAEKLRERGLAVDDRGWICVNRHLQSTSHPSLFAAGDCCTITDPGFKPPPKAGVYAVRSGPILIQNLVARFTGKPLVEYKPQDDFLKLLMCGDGTAFGFRFGLGLKGKWVWEMKNHIDQMFMDLFKEENLPDLSNGAPLNCAQFDAHDVVDVDGILPEEAARELSRDDDGVKYLQNWGIIKKMTRDVAFRAAVLAHC